MRSCGGGRLECQQTQRVPKRGKCKLTGAGAGCQLCAPSPEKGDGANSPSRQIRASTRPGRARHGGRRAAVVGSVADHEARASFLVETLYPWKPSLLMKLQGRGYVELRAGVSSAVGIAGAKKRRPSSRGLLVAPRGSLERGGQHHELPRSLCGTSAGRPH